MVIGIKIVMDILTLFEIICNDENTTKKRNTNEGLGCHHISRVILQNWHSASYDS